MQREKMEGKVQQAKLRTGYSKKKSDLWFTGMPGLKFIAILLLILGNSIFLVKKACLVKFRLI